MMIEARLKAGPIRFPRTTAFYNWEIDLLFVRCCDKKPKGAIVTDDSSLIVSVCGKPDTEIESLELLVPITEWEPASTDESLSGPIRACLSNVELVRPKNAPKIIYPIRTNDRRNMAQVDFFPQEEPSNWIVMGDSLLLGLTDNNLISRIVVLNIIFDHACKKRRLLDEVFFDSRADFPGPASSWRGPQTTLTGRTDMAKGKGSRMG